MKDYTEIFSEAISSSAGYEIKPIAEKIDSLPDTFCGNDWGYDNWYMIAKRIVRTDMDYYGYISCRYPVALLTRYCPDSIRSILTEHKIIYTELKEPMTCDVEILRQFVPEHPVFNENFLDDCAYAFDDERFLMVLYKLETGHQRYVDAGHFTFREIK